MSLIVGKSFASSRSAEAFVTASIEYCILLCGRTSARAQGTCKPNGAKEVKGAREMTAAVISHLPRAQEHVSKEHIVEVLRLVRGRRRDAQRESSLRRRHRRQPLLPRPVHIGRCMQRQTVEQGRDLRAS